MLLSPYIIGRLGRETYTGFNYPNNKGSLYKL